MTKHLYEVVVDRNTFAIALQCSKTTKTAVIHEILLHFVQNPGKQQLEDVMKHLEKAIGDRIYAKNNPISNPNEEFRTHMNFKGEGGNTLLHQAVISNNTQAIEAFLKYGADPLIKNRDGHIPLDLAEIKTEEVLIKCMKDQAELKKENARYSSLIGIIPGISLGIGIGVGSALAGPSMAVMLGTIAASILIVGVAVGLTIYFLSQDREQARAIEKAIKPSSVNNEVPHVHGNGDNKHLQSIA